MPFDDASESRPAWAPPLLPPSPPPAAAGAPTTSDDGPGTDHAATGPTSGPTSGLATGIDGARIRQAFLSAAAVVGSVLVLLVAAVAVAVLTSPDAAEATPADVVRLAVLLLGPGAGGQLSVSARVGEPDAWVTVAGHLTAVPLAVTAALVTGWYLAGRRRRAVGSVREHVQDGVLTGLASAALLAGLMALAAVRTLPEWDAWDQLGSGTSLLRLDVHVEAWRVAVVGGLFAATASLAARLWRWTRTASTTGGGHQRTVALWAPAVGLATRLVLALGAAASLALLVVLVVDAATGGGAGDVGLEDAGPAGWVGVLLVLPTAALGALGFALGGTAAVEVQTSGVAGSLGDLSALGDAAGRSAGLGVGDYPAQLGWVVGGALLVVVLVALRAGLLRDPRHRLAGDWWRTALATAVAWGAIVIATRVSLGLTAEPGGGLQLATAVLGDAVGLQDGSVSGAAELTAGLSWASTAVSGAVVGLVASAAATWLPRPVAGLFPRGVSGARWLPHRLHPVWVLLLVDALERWGRPVPAVLRGVAEEVAPTVQGLRQLTVDRVLSRATGAVLVACCAAVVVVPVAYHALETGHYGPEPVAREYAAAFADGDAPALAAASGHHGGLLTQAALDAQREQAAVTAVHLGELDGDGDGDGTRSAELRYRVGDEQASLPVTLVRHERRGWALFPTWTVSAPVPVLHLQVPVSATAVEVAGQALDESTVASARSGTDVEVFPGAVSVRASVPDPFTATPWTGTVSDSTTARVVAGLTREGEEQARAAADEWLAACALSTALAPAGCPVRLEEALGDRRSDVHWSFSASRGSAVAVQVLSDGTVRAGGHARGSGWYTYGYTADDLFDYGLPDLRSSATFSVSYTGVVSFDRTGARFRLQSSDVTNG